MAATFSLTSLSELLDELFEQVREGVVLCDAEGTVLAANRTATLQLGRTSLAATGLEELFAEPYISNALAYVQKSPDSKIDFLCPVRDGNNLFDCRLYRYGMATVDSLFCILTFKEAIFAGDRSLSEGRRCDSIGKLRQPLANLKAAAENLLAYPDMSPVMRSAFENVIAQESASLTLTFDDLAGLCSESLTGICAPAPVDGGALVDRAMSLAGCPPGLTRPVTGDSRDVLADGRWLQQLLLSLFEFLTESGISLVEIKFCPEPTGRFIYLDMCWEGAPLKAAGIEEWRRLPLSKVPGAPSGAEILRGHGSDLWSQESEKPGFSLVRLPLPLVPSGRDNG